MISAMIALSKTESQNTREQVCRYVICVTGYEILTLVEINQGSHMLEKYLNMTGFLEKSLKMKYAKKSTGESL